MSNEMICPDCGTNKWTESAVSGAPFEYGDTTLTADVVVLSCDGCDFKCTDHRTEDARTEAIKKHLIDKALGLVRACV